MVWWEWSWEMKCTWLMWTWHGRLTVGMLLILLPKYINWGMLHVASIILIHVPCIFYYFVLWPTNAQLFHKLSHSYMFRHYRVILSELTINTLPSYTVISSTAGADWFLRQISVEADRNLSTQVHEIWHLAVYETAILLMCVMNSVLFLNSHEFNV